MDSKPPLRINNLPLDILIDILKSLPSFSCLRSLVLSHRAFNEVWKAHPNEIAWAITSNAFEPRQEAINLMLEQLYPRDSNAAASKTPACLKLPIEDIKQLHTNEVYIGILERYRSDAQKFWRGCPLPGSGCKILSFRRAAYRAWLFVLTMELPRGLSMCDALSLMELSEMRCVVEDFQPRLGWPGLPSFSALELASAAAGLEQAMQQRMWGYALCDLTSNTVDVFVMESSYAWLNVKDEGFRESDFLLCAEKLEENENRWRAKIKWEEGS